MNDRQMSQSETQAWAVAQKEAGRCAKLQSQIDSMTRERNVLYEQLTEARRKLAEAESENVRLRAMISGVEFEL